MFSRNIKKTVGFLDKITRWDCIFLENHVITLQNEATSTHLFKNHKPHLKPNRYLCYCNDNLSPNLNRGGGSTGKTILTGGEH